MSKLRDIPEVAALRSGRGVVRIPPELDVPLTPRVRRLIDTSAFRRLASISQLGLVSLVYPGARHTRFEHSLGVYRVALEFLDRLAEDARFVEAVDEQSAVRFLATALLHDIGHWPFCHPIEDLKLGLPPHHEHAAAAILQEGEVAELLSSDWGIDGAEMASLLAGNLKTTAEQVLHSMLSGPIDVDKLDYLMRDSLHAGVPYGRHFDAPRLVQSLCLNEAGDAIALSDKGKTAAEMMVFARYVMFSEVYWHHAVRSATAMLQRAFYSVLPQLEIPKLLTASDAAMIEQLRSLTAPTLASGLVEGLFGERRQLYKRVAQYSLFQQPALYKSAARRPYPELVAGAQRLAELASCELGEPVAPHEVLIDAPPVELEVQFDIAVYYPAEHCYRKLAEVSPMVHTLAVKQFDDYVKRVRVFAHPRIAAQLRKLDALPELLAECF